MIQRKQTLFLLALVLTGVALFFVPANTVTVNGQTHGLSLAPSSSSEYTTSAWHSLAIVLNGTAILLGLITIFLYTRRPLQVRLCFVLMLLQLTLTLILSLCHLAVDSEALSISGSGFAIIISTIGMISAYLAARLIKKDIELLRSADRIR
jgi:hypothetical protein